MPRVDRCAQDHCEAPLCALLPRPAARQTHTLREAAETFLAGAESGAIRHARRKVFKPSVVRSYRQSLNDHVLPALGNRRLSDITDADLNRLVETLQGRGLAGSTVRNAIAPVRAIYRRALKLREVAVNPTVGLDLPKADSAPARVASPAEAYRLLAALPEEDRPLWALAFFAGLRCGEVQALRWEDITLPREGSGRIRVERAYDPKSRRYVAPKSKAGTRTVPIPGELREQLQKHALRTGRREGLIFGRDGVAPFTSSNVGRRARTAWKRAGLEPLTLHEGRHTYASFMIAAGLNAKALQTLMGIQASKSLSTTYGHLFPGHEDEAAALMDGYLAARLARSA